ncbi:protein PRY2-like [Teleopsis dalmanni]|uniref:protein PRY2-like n=1 Tax=Teleopsis dalmanni TaxID=139649 RepID=UPI0018CEAB92|nr:protein PRY2-like [Teleopsis dalmanni]
MFRKSLVTILLIFVIGSVEVNSKIIAECGNQSGFIPNPDENCEYTWINCDGENSQYCNTECEDSFDCNQGVTTSNPTTVTATTVAATTVAATTVTATTVTATTVTPTTPILTQSTTNIPTIVTEPTTTTTLISTTTVFNVRDECQPGVDDTYPYLDNTNYYYRCLNGYLLIYQCPIGYNYDPILKSCRKS